MNFENFEKETINYLQEYYKDDAKITAVDVKKNNGIIKRGVMVRFDGSDACPTLYLNDYYTDILEGKTFAHVMNMLTKMIDETGRDVQFDVSCFDSYEKMKDKVLCKLINKEKNAILLDEVPYVDFLDLAVVFYVIIRNEKVGSGSILIRNEHLKVFGVSVDQMFEDAKENNKRILGSFITGIEELLLSMIKRGIPNVPKESEQLLQTNVDNGNTLPLYVLSNIHQMHGAACMLDNDCLENFSERINADFYIIPSSIHELILIPEMGGRKEDELNEMINYVNETDVPMGEVLSNHVYKYDRKNHCVIMNA